LEISYKAEGLKEKPVRQDGLRFGRGQLERQEAKLEDTEGIRTIRTEYG
jgi:hypothetical protein